MVGSTVPYYAQDGSSQQQYPQQGAPAAVPGEQQQYPSAPYTYPSQMAPGGAVPGAQQGASPTPTASTQRGSPMLTGPPEHNSNASSPSSAQPTGSDGRPGVSVSSLLDATGKPNKKGRSDADKDMVNRLGRS